MLALLGEGRCNTRLYGIGMVCMHLEIGVMDWLWVYDMIQGGIYLHIKIRVGLTSRCV